MLNILIATKRDDSHANAISFALRKIGHNPICWFGAEFPVHQVSSIAFEKGGFQGLNLKGKGVDFSSEDIDVIWFRRPDLPSVPETLHPDDKEVAVRENNGYNKAIWLMLEESNAFWINSFSSREKSNSKATQLRKAAKLGLQIPITLISNDPSRVRQFLSDYNDHGVIYKSFAPAAWTEGGVRSVLRASQVSADLLPNDATLQLTPGIFQVKVQKAFELRLTFFGTHCIAAKLDSQNHQDGEIDWRNIPPRELKVLPYDMPPEVSQLCVDLMKSLDIVFGCFDFIVTPQNEFIFLEVNEMGQFLWLEEACPDLLMLDTFCAFITARTFEFAPSVSDNPLRLSEIYHSKEFAEAAAAWAKSP